ncbi:T9SS type A sorting domain-containing protein [Aestuariibaculum sp. YM273]|uniref:T9SS type A sorting domain-containing protein n=1 Tax=Aestuariibaculum sp. YM273 TaxID=3070659 RepID=UPI0027DD715E|nr:T9SS type A sorting domain-containing protein [Aestuariibaculum sp. YM273]WMI66848.1 T9SS type A sorting domain-containing protein [Aestuariibaculum sp. YM273]
MNLKITITLMLLLIVNKVSGQITLTLDEIYLNNQTSIENCNTVDFGLTTNNYLVFYYTLQKPINQAVSDGTIKVILKYDSSSSSEKNSSVIGSALWNTTDMYSNSITANIQASQIQASGSSILLEFSEGGYTYKSCEYPLIKIPTPEFNLQPTSVSFGCGSISSRAFTAVNVYNSPGAVSYNWNVGTGWKQNGTPVNGTFTTTTNSITLEPVSGSVLPSNVTMTATLNGVVYPPKTTTISRSAMSQTITAISGPSTICSGNTNYNFGTENVLPGQTVTWSLSNSSVASLSNTSNTGVTLNLIGSGEVTLTATISNDCGQSYSKTKKIFGGSPPFFNVARGTAQSETCDTKYHYVPFTIANKSPLLTYSINVYGNNSGSFAYFTNDGFVLEFTDTYNDWATFTVTASNSCGSRTVLHEVYIDDCSSLPYGSSSSNKSMDKNTILSIYPNPSSSTINLNLNETLINLERDEQIKASIYNTQGIEKQKINIKNNYTPVNISKLPKGLYILIVDLGYKTESHMISIE